MAIERFQNPSATVSYAPPVIPEHELLRRIGEGAYGEVWLARSITGALRAVKIVYRARFTDERPYEREFNGITKFEPLSRSNEGLVDILQVGRDDRAQCFYYIMELADPLEEQEQPQENALKADPGPRRHFHFDPAKYVARTLRADVQRRGRLSCHECVQLGMSLSLALGHLHRHGLLHRDVKPSNIIFVGGVPKLADIGLVTELAEAHSYVGTEGFIPPDGPNSPQADLYSLGKVLYEASMGKDRQEFPEPRTNVLDDPEAPALLELNAVVVKACASDRRERYQSAEEMHADLALLYSGRSVKRKRVLEQRVAWMSKVGPLVTVVALLATGAYLVQRRQTGEIRRLAKAESLQRQRAEIALEQADQNFTELALERAEEDFAADRAASGLAGLAQVLRAHPTNRVAAERLLAALTQRNFLLPTLPELTLETNVTAAEFSPDGNLLVIGTADGKLRFWDTQSGNLSELPAGEAVIENAAFNKTLSQVILLGSDHVVRYLDVARRQYARPLTNAAASRLLDLTDDGHWLAASGDDGAIRVWDLESRELAGPPILTSQPITQIHLSADGESLCSSTTNFLSQVWQTRTGQPRSPTFRQWFHLAPSFSPDGRWLLLESDFSAARVWDSVTFKPVGAKLTHATWLSALHFSPDGQQVVTGSGDRTTRVWDAHTGQPVTPPMLHRALVNSAQFSPEGRRLLVTTRDGTARLWDAQSGLPLSEPLGLGNIESAQFSPDGERILVITGERRLLLLDARPTRALARMLQNDQTVRVADLSPDNSQLLCLNIGTAAMLWNLRTHPAVGVPLGHARSINYAQFSPDGRLIATAGDDKAVRLWDAATGRMVGKPILQESEVNSVQFDVTGKRIITGAADGTARVWDIETGQALDTPIRHSSGVRAAAFSSDGEYAITQAHDHAVQIWKLGPEPALFRELRHDGDAGFVISTDGKRLATYSLDQTARVWDTYAGRALSPVLKHNNDVITAGLSPDGQRLVTGCRDGTAHLWDAASGKSVVMLHEGTVKIVGFSPDGRRIFTGCDNGFARLWDADSGQPVSEPLPQESDINSARFTSDGKWLASVSADGAARIWEVLSVTHAAPAWLPDLAEAVAGKRLEERRAVLALDDQGFWRVRQAIAASTEADEFTSWAKWFFSPREHRSFSPGTSLTLADWIDECLETKSPVFLQATLRAAPTEPRPIAALVLENLASSSTNSVNLAGTEWLSRYSTRRWPNSGAVWQARAEVLLSNGKVDEALPAIQHALDLQPKPSLCLLKSQILESTGDLVGAAQACASGLCLVSNSPACSAELRQRLGFQQVNTLRQLGRSEEALADLKTLKPFPCRDLQAPTNALDLTLTFNARLDEDWHRHADLGNNLASLTPGLHTFDGITFDVRGIVQLHGQLPDLDPLYPERINAIGVQRPCRQLHFLHGTGWGIAEGTTIANWIIHWADGHEESVPVVYGRDVRNWQFWPTMRQESGGAQPVWKGPQARWKDKTTSGVRLYHTTWQNPRPDIPVASVDYVSAGAASAPFLLAITAE